MNDKIVPFRRRGPAGELAPVVQTTPGPVPEDSGDWTMVQIVVQAPPTSR